MMNFKKNQDIVTDAAWNNIYRRFEQEGLLPAQAPKLKPKRAFLCTTNQWWRAAAAMVVLCILSTLLIRQLTALSSDMLTLHNEDRSATLVTTLEDGSIVYLSQAASLDYPFHFRKDKRMVTMQGDAFFEISKNRERPFVIDTDLAQVEVLGTAFNVVSKDNESFSLAVKHGEVKVTLKKTGQSVLVKGGETVQLGSGSLQKSTISALGQFDKYTKQIHFKDERLADIVRIINLNSNNMSLELSPELADRRLTVAFIDDTPQMMSELICLALNLKSTTKDNIITITNP